MNRAQEYALEDFLDEKPNGCETSFNAGWHAAMLETKRRKIQAHRITRLNDKSPRWDNELTTKYEEAKALVIKGYTKAESCLQVGISYDSFMRRQRIEWRGRDREQR